MAYLLLKKIGAFSGVSFFLPARDLRVLVPLAALVLFFVVLLSSVMVRTFDHFDLMGSASVVVVVLFVLSGTCTIW